MTPHEIEDLKFVLYIGSVLLFLMVVPFFPYFIKDIKMIIKKIRNKKGEK